MNLRIQEVARLSAFRGDMLQRTGVDPENWSLAQYSDAALVWIKERVTAQEDGETKWIETESMLWDGIEDPERIRKAGQQAAAAFRRLGFM